MLAMVYSIKDYDETVQRVIDVLTSNYGSVEYRKDRDVMEVHTPDNKKDGTK